MKWCVVSVRENPIACSPRVLTAARCASCSPAGPAFDDSSPPGVLSPLFKGQSGCCLPSDIKGQSGCAAASFGAFAPDCFCARIETATAAATLNASTQRRRLLFFSVLPTFLPLHRSSDLSFFRLRQGGAGLFSSRGRAEAASDSSRRAPSPALVFERRESQSASAARSSSR